MQKDAEILLFDEKTAYQNRIFVIENRHIWVDIFGCFTIAGVVDVLINLLFGNTVLNSPIGMSIFPILAIINIPLAVIGKIVLKKRERYSFLKTEDRICRIKVRDDYIPEENDGGKMTKDKKISRDLEYVKKVMELVDKDGSEREIQKKPYEADLYKEVQFVKSTPKFDLYSGHDRFGRLKKIKIYMKYRIFNVKLESQDESDTIFPVEEYDTHYTNIKSGWVMLGLAGAALPLQVGFGSFVLSAISVCMNLFGIVLAVWAIKVKVNHDGKHANVGQELALLLTHTLGLGVAILIFTYLMIF